MPGVPAAIHPVAGAGFRRRRFLDASQPARELAWSRRLLALLLAQTGSTTRLCEWIASGPVGLELVHQAWRDAPPPALQGIAGQGPTLERVTTIHAHGEAMMDNLVFVPGEGLGDDLLEGLRAGTIPVGHLVDRGFTRRSPMPTGAERDAFLDLLWARFGLAEPEAARAYILEISGGPRLLIAEAYRHGMLRDPA